LNELCEKIRVGDAMPQLMQAGSKCQYQFGSVEFPQNPSMQQYIAKSKANTHNNDDRTTSKTDNLQIPLKMG
jgi:hypothetical protein